MARRQLAAHLVDGAVDVDVSAGPGHVLRLDQHIFGPHLQNDVRMGADEDAARRDIPQHMVEHGAALACIEGVDPHQDSIHAAQLFADLSHGLIVIGRGFRLDTMTLKLFTHGSELTVRRRCPPMDARVTRIHDRDLGRPAHRPHRLRSHLDPPWSSRRRDGRQKERGIWIHKGQRRAPAGALAGLPPFPYPWCNGRCVEGSIGAEVRQGVAR